MHQMSRIAEISCDEILREGAVQVKLTTTTKKNNQNQQMQTENEYSVICGEGN